MRKTRSLVGIVLLTIVLALGFLGAVVRPALAQSSVTITFGARVRYSGRAFDCLECWKKEEKWFWVVVDFSFYGPNCFNRDVYASGEGILLDVRGEYARVTWQGEAVWLRASQVWRIDPPLLLKGIPTPTPEKQNIPTKMPCGVFYVVQWADTLEGIAKGHETTVAALAELNNFDNIHVIWAGSRICVR